MSVPQAWIFGTGHIEVDKLTVFGVFLEGTAMAGDCLFVFARIFESYRNEVWDQDGADVYFDAGFQSAGDVAVGTPEMFGVIGI
jgi:hypothetical protein